MKQELWKNKRLKPPIKASISLTILVQSYYPGGLVGKEPACSAGDPGSSPGSGRPAGEGNGYPLQYSFLGKSQGQRNLLATVHGVTRVRQT